MRKVTKSQSEDMDSDDMEKVLDSGGEEES